MNINVNGLEYFIAIAETGSFTKAAQRCNITQTAISQNIRNMEDNLGFSLFDRSTRHVTLTPAGRTFYNHARIILEQFDTAIAKSRNVAAGEAGHIVLLLPGYAEGMVLIPRIREFQKRFPEVRLIFRFCLPKDISDKLKSRQGDVAVFWPHEFLASDFSVHLIANFRLDLMCSPDHPITSRSYVTLSDLQNVRLTSVDFSRMPYMNRNYSKMWTQAGLDVPEIVSSGRVTTLDELEFQIALDPTLTALVPEFLKTHVTKWHKFIPLKGDIRQPLSAVTRTKEMKPELTHFVDILTDSRIPLNY